MPRKDSVPQQGQSPHSSQKTDACATGIVNIDLDRATAFVAGDVELLAELAVIFDEDLPDHIAAFQSAVHSRDVESVHRVVHKLKGSTAPFFASPLADQLSSLMLSTSNGDLTAVQEDADHLIANLNGLRATLIDCGLLKRG